LIDNFWNALVSSMLFFDGQLACAVHISLSFILPCN